MYVCVSSYVCMCLQHMAIRSICCISKAGTEFIGILLPLPLCAAGIPGVLHHNCIMKKIVHLVCVNKND